MYVPAVYHTSSAHHIFSIFHGAQQPFFCPSKKSPTELSLRCDMPWSSSLPWNPLRAPPCAASAPSRPGRGAGGHGLPLRGWGLGVSVSAVALQRQSRRSRDARAARNAEKAEKKSLGSCTFEVFSMILRKWICKMMLERKQIQPELLTILSVSYRSPSNPSNHSLFDICLLSSLCSHASSTRSKNTNAANSDSWKRNQTNYLSDSFMRELLQTLASPTSIRRAEFRSKVSDLLNSSLWKPH